MLPDETRQLLDSIDAPDHAALFALMACTGMQLNEALALTRADVRLRRTVPIVRIPGIAATGRRRAVPARSVPVVDTRANDLLVAHLRQLGAGQGRALWPVSRQSAATWLTHALAQLRTAGHPIGELPITLSSFRTGFAVTALVYRVPAPSVQRWLGLRRRESLARYERLLETTDHELMQRLPPL